MARSIVSVNGLAIREPTNLGFEFYNLTKSGRLASGKMTIELVAQKRKFTFMYEVISGPQLDQIKAAIYSPSAMFFPLVYLENDVHKTCIVYSGALKALPWRKEGLWYWKNVTFDLIEQ